MTTDKHHEYVVVDVFADQPLAGNPLAVVTGSDDLTAEQMARIAVEFNLSETTFVSTPTLEGADWRLRSFTPAGEEVSGAGHNALGAWWWLATSGRAAAPGAAQELGGRVLAVRIEAPADGPLTIGLAQGPVEFTRAACDTKSVLDVLAPDHGACDDNVDLVCGSVGSVHLLVPLATVAQVDAARPDNSALRELLVDTGAQGCYVYTRAVDGHGLEPGLDAYARFFNPTVGIAEDPATGSAAGPLAAHLTGRGYADGTVRVLQGRAMGRPSILSITVGSDGTTLSGRCALAAAGQLYS